ncbi:uncharacterized protein B0T15DRAFT_174985 [Chaetomium strumarium]|uniref:Uncharacterized protein n=1 Tax=Chaetomium strumarium TaxID=1170767 RepID=A0AAJ0M3H4_9PEZI|nr:hypothetical protein B0T15DRAFT_174985 [Chaetomium strumarium]
MEYSETSRRLSHRLMTVGKMGSQEEFPIWRCRFLNIMKCLDLDKYLMEDIPEPESASERAQWHDDREDVEECLRAAIPGLAVWFALQSMGWREEEKHPKKTFDMLARYFDNHGPRNNRAAAAALPAPPQINSIPTSTNDMVAGPLPPSLLSSLRNCAPL